MPPQRNRRNGAGRNNDHVVRLLRECMHYVFHPYSVPLPTGLRPSDVIQLLLDNVAQFTLGEAIHARAAALEPGYSGKITAMLLDRSSHHELLQIVFRAHVQEAKTVYKAHIRRLREESAEMEEAPFTLPATPEPSRNHQYDPSVQIHTYRRPRRFATADINNGRSSASDEARDNARVNTALLPQHHRPRPQYQIQQTAQNRNPHRALQAAGRNANGVHLQFLNGLLIFRWVGTGNELQIDMEGAMRSPDILTPYSTPKIVINSLTES
ncbi:Poly(A) binding protein [Diaporthe amygdali]|uniref:Poly(A) binding protein n=1 Tax=Phomopsis amygdali TaxID=1214568 RepID=UPI0022FDEFA5|nr:Poly(A) binding protein [Diaporthe amygdali]KAJ0119265.1 Poly(A) binding protein [Diaporthe amygdali]